MKKNAGFTLIELVLFILITGFLASSILIAFSAMLLKSPSLQENMVAVQTARKCMEWYIGQRFLNGYSALTCPSTPTPTMCSAPAGYSVSSTITCTSISSDNSYKTILVSVTGLSNATLTSLIGDY